MDIPQQIGRGHAVLAEFRRALRTGLVASAGGETRLAIEGPRLIGEAIRSGLRIERILFSATGFEQLGAKLQPQLSKHAAVCVAPDAAFAAAMNAEHPQGVAALVVFRPAALDEVFGDGRAPALVVAAAEMQDPGNLGTLLRAADAFGATGVVTLTDTVSPFNPKAVRASAGSLFHLPVAARVEAAALIAACAARAVRLVAASARAESGLDAALAGPLCLVIGQEAGGVPRALQRAAETVAIPMARGVDSLNAGVAGAILLYETARQRRSPPSAESPLP